MININIKTNQKTISSHLDTYIFILLIIAASFLRLYQLDARPFHHDEAAVGSLTYKFFTQGNYQYNPVFHGPFLYYLTVEVFKLLGDNEFSARLMPAITGVGMVLLVYPLRAYLGRPGWLITSAFFAFSPSFLYYSRFFRNDIFITFFTLTAVVCAAYYIKQGNNPERLVFLALGSAALGLSVTAKENGYITMALFGAPVGLFVLYRIWIGLHRHNPGYNFILFLEGNFFRLVMDIGLFIVVFLIIYMLFYSYFFKDMDAVINAPFDAFSHWFEMHKIERIGGPPYYYIPLLILYELPIFIFAVIGSVEYIKRFVKTRENIFTAFTVYWFISSLAAYSYVGEKVPWLVLHPLLGAILIAGAYIGETLSGLKYRPVYVEALFMTVLILSSSFFLYTSYILNFKNYSNPAEPLIQASQPPQKFELFISTLHETAQKHDGYATVIQDTDKEMDTQLLWHLRHYTNVKWRVNLENDPPLDAPIVIVHDEEADIAENLLIGPYQRLDSAKMAWYFYELADINYRFIMYRELDRLPGEYGVVLFYR
jgi:uncharacterized protein (TIGR03663 family)